MESTTEAEYAAFEEKMKRTFYCDNLSPHVTEPVMRAAFDQFGTVKSVKFLPNYLEPKNIPRCALVEMEKAQEAKKIIAEVAQFPFMVGGMPRPVRARPAEVGMFDDRPKKPGRVIRCRWIDSSDHDFDVAKKLKHLTEKHAAEASFLLKKQLEREEELHKQQVENLKANFKKYEMIDAVMNDRTAQKLAHRYSIRLGDD